MDAAELLRDTADRAIRYLTDLDERPVHATATLDELRSAFGGDMPDEPGDPGQVVATLADAAVAGVVGTMSPRFTALATVGHRTSVSNWQTSEDDADRSVAAIVRAAC